LQLFRKAGFLILLFILNSLAHSANTPVFEHLSIDDGLSSSTVFSILQDDGGFMWFGTINGLNKYDGYTFKVFEYDPEDSTTISNTSAGNIYKDHEGYIWVGTWGGGLNRFCPKTHTAIRYQPDPKDPGSISGIRVQCIFEDSNHRIWAGTYSNGLNLLNSETGSFSHYKHEPDNENSLSNNRIWSIAEDSLGYLWIGTSYGLNRLNLKTGKIKHYFADPNDENALCHNTVRALKFTKRNELWIGTEKGLDKFNFETEHFERFFYQPTKSPVSNKGRVNTIYETRNGDLYIGTGYGVVKLDPVTDSSERYVHDPSRPGSLGDNEVRSIFEDRNGILWFGNRGRGVDKYNPNHKKFQNLTFSSSPEQASKENTVFTICQVGEDLYLNNFSSLLRYNRRSGKLFRYENISGLTSSMNDSRKRTLYHSQIDTNIIWISINSNIIRFNIRTHKNLKPHSLIINATGLGKDKPGSPFTWGVQFPQFSIVWELNYRGELIFLDQAEAQKKEKNLIIHDGWVYFIHGWIQVIAEVFHLDIPTRGPSFEKLSDLARSIRK